jgi:hypothetical protein
VIGVGCRSLQNLDRDSAVFIGKPEVMAAALDRDGTPMFDVTLSETTKIE